MADVALSYSSPGMLRSAISSDAAGDRKGLWRVSNVSQSLLVVHHDSFRDIGPDDNVSRYVRFSLYLALTPTDIC